MTRGLILALVLALAGAAAAPAEPAVDKAKVRKVLEQTGLMGFWAIDCSRDSTPDNPWETFTVGEDGYVLDGDYEGTDGEAFYVVDARRLNRREVWMKLEMTLGEPEMEAVYRIEGDRFRPWSLRHASGEFLMKDGEWQTDQEPSTTRWYHRCPNGFPGQPSAN